MFPFFFQLMGPIGFRDGRNRLIGRDRNRQTTVNESLIFQTNSYHNSPIGISKKSNQQQTQL